MYDKAKILPGLAVFVALIGAPIWYNAARGTPARAPELQLPDPSLATECIEHADYMRASHMDLLNVWRDAVVRKGERTHVNSAGKEFRMSLTGTCMQCHQDKQAFCDSCHNYAGVAPSCWTCHVDPQEAVLP